MKVILLVGMPGSGKSTLGKRMIEEDDNTTNTLFLDDISILAKDAKKYLQDLPEKESIETLIISDVHFCIDQVRTSASKVVKEVFPNAEIEWIYFENDPEKCLENVAERKVKGDARKVTGMIEQLTKIYQIPEKEQVQEIYSKNKLPKNKLKF